MCVLAGGASSGARPTLPRAWPRTSAVLWSRPIARQVPIEWNYGAFPQTWEQPDHAWAGLEALAEKGDNDPLDVVDLGASGVPCGSVVEMKLIGVLAMIDEGEVDWKARGRLRLRKRAACVTTTANSRATTTPPMGVPSHGNISSTTASTARTSSRRASVVRSVQSPQSTATATRQSQPCQAFHST